MAKFTLSGHAPILGEFIILFLEKKDYPAQNSEEGGL